MLLDSQSTPLAPLAVLEMDPGVRDVSSISGAASFPAVSLQLGGLRRLAANFYFLTRTVQSGCGNGQISLHVHHRLHYFIESFVCVVLRLKTDAVVQSVKY